MCITSFSKVILITYFMHHDFISFINFLNQHYSQISHLGKKKGGGEGGEEGGRRVGRCVQYVPCPFTFCIFSFTNTLGKSNMADKIQDINIGKWRSHGCALEDLESSGTKTGVMKRDKDLKDKLNVFPTIQ